MGGFIIIITCILFFAITILCLGMLISPYIEIAPDKKTVPDQKTAPNKNSSPFSKWLEQYERHVSKLREEWNQAHDYFCDALDYIDLCPRFDHNLCLAAYLYYKYNTFTIIQYKQALKELEPKRDSIPVFRDWINKYALYNPGRDIYCIKESVIKDITQFNK